MSQDVRRDEEQITQRRAQLLGLEYIDTIGLKKQLFKDVLSVQELYELKVIPLIAGSHKVVFGIITTTMQQTLTNLKKRFSDQIVSFALISESGFGDYMRLYDPPEEVVYKDIAFSEKRSSGEQMVADVSKTLDEVRPEDMLAYLVQQAFRLNSSDIHLENMRENIRVRL